MAINFEAANMAGYNNPKIEVFTAVMGDDESTIVQYPNKTAILASINRGSIPFLMLTLANHTQKWILPIANITEGSGGYSLAFGCYFPTSATEGVSFGVYYPEGADAAPVIYVSP